MVKTTLAAKICYIVGIVIIIYGVFDYFRSVQIYQSGWTRTEYPYRTEALMIMGFGFIVFILLPTIMDYIAYEVMSKRQN